jgi:XTP/dITP diphosphohydrolase
LASSRPDRLFIATRNQGKLAEFRHGLAGLVGEVIGLDEAGEVPEVVEDGDTFAANATKKAVEVRAATGAWVLADDSGLVVDALGGAPGGFSARYATAADRARLGIPGDAPPDVANNTKLLAALADVAGARRSARFVAVLALAGPEDEVRLFEGACEGRIGRAPRGRLGFGYDPLFEPEAEWPESGGRGRSMAELAIEEKARISHRGRAIAALAEWLQRSG